MPAMIEHAILTAIGADRPGLVDEVSQFIFAQGGNIEDSRMVNLRGQFAMMVLLSAADDAMTRLRQELDPLAARLNLHAQIRPAQISTTAAAAMPWRLTATAMDQPGLVHRISHLLRSQGVNIESLETRLSAAPITGAPLFEMELAVAIPAQTPIGPLRQKLGALCDELNIDWRIEAM